MLADRVAGGGGRPGKDGVRVGGAGHAPQTELAESEAVSGDRTRPPPAEGPPGAAGGPPPPRPGPPPAGAAATPAESAGGPRPTRPADRTAQLGVCDGAA